MRIGVIGAGAIGGAMAALLARAGNEVEVVARGDNLRAIAANGIHLTGAWGEFTARVGAVESLSGIPDLAIVATKAQDATAAIAANAPSLAGVTVVVVQNGLGAIRDAAPLLPGSPLVGALALAASSYRGPGEIAVGTAGPTYLGGNDPSAIERAVTILSPAMPVMTTPNFVGAQWTKLVVNQVNALPAITGLSVQQVAATPALRRILTRSMREAVRVGRANRIRFAELQGLTPSRLSLVSRAPLSIAQIVPRRMAARMGAVPNPGSTLQSIRRGVATEIDYLNGAVVRAAQNVGMTAPVNAVLVTLVHEVERTGVFLSVDEVAARVG